jgi:two-component system phosphate regulon sensor histidine kinase PhoR
LNSFFSRRPKYSEDQIKEALNALRDGIILFDGNNKIIWSNKNASEWLNLNDPFSQENIRAFFPTSDFDHFLSQSGENSSLEAISPFNKSIFFSLQIIPFGETEKILVLRDITKPIRLEKVRTDFAANASHELRSPLTVISGYIDLMVEDKSIPVNWKKPIQDLAKQSERMKSVLSDLLVLFQLESESKKADEEIVDLQAIVMTVKKDCMAAKKPPKKFEVEFKSKGVVIGDETKMQSIVMNLIENAIRYSNNEGEIKVSWTLDEVGGHLSIKDNGIGIEEKHLSRITERFYRIDKGRSRKMGGTGLGLAIVKYALQAHEATLEIKSQIGIGSEFICHFPESRSNIK